MEDPPAPTAAAVIGGERRVLDRPLLRSYGIVIRYLNRVGLGARDPFACPLVAELRIH